MKASSNKTDIYAVGILFKCNAYRKISKEKPAQGKLWNVIERCISLDANSRYRADELIERLDNYLGRIRMQEKRTDELDELLEKMKPEQLGDYYKDNKNIWQMTRKHFLII